MTEYQCECDKCSSIHLKGEVNQDLYSMLLEDALAKERKWKNTVIAKVEAEIAHFRKAGIAALIDPALNGMAMVRYNALNEFLKILNEEQKKQ